MKLVPALMLLAVLVPRPGVYVKGHSRAADKVRASLENFTCYAPGELENSSATLQVDHILARSGRSWIVLVLMDAKQKTLWAGKGEEYPWPIRSPLGKLLRNMAKSTCRDNQSTDRQEAANPESSTPPVRSVIPHGAFVRQRPH